MSTKFNKRQLPDSTVYNDEETTFQAKVLLPIATPTDDKEAITFKFYKDKREEIDTEISLLKNPDRITVNAGYTLLGQDLTFNPDWKVVIDAVEYTNTAQVILNFPLASAGYSRLDLVAFTKDSTFVRVAGVESLTTPVAPTTPPDTVYITVVFVSDVSVNEPEPPQVDGAYIKKSELANVILNGTGLINMLALTDEKATIVFKGSITQLNTISYASVPYNGKRITLFNAQATPVTIGHSVSGYGVDFVFADGQDYILLPNQTIEFSFDITYAPYAHHMLIGSKGITNWSELQGKPSTFPPSSHTHPISDVTGLPTALDDLQLNKEDKANKNIANGYAGLDSSGKINPIQLPALAVTDTFVVASQAEQLALVAEVGDVAVRTDLNKSFILKVTGASTLANWQELLSPTSVDQTIIDGSTNAVSSNAVFDALATKAPISSVHNPVTLGTANGLSLATQQLSLGLASSGVTGALSGTDWNTFNGKFNTPTGLTTNYLPKWNGSGFWNSQVFDNGTNVGIGTTAPATKLEVAGSIISVRVDTYPTIGATNYGSVGFPLVQLRNVKNGVEKAWNIENGRIVNGDLGFYNEGGQRVTIKDNGRVLINKTDDDLTNQLQVAGTISASPATTANQVPTWGQVQAVASSSGTYIPTVSASTNCVSPSALPSTYTKNGNIVTLRLNVLASNFTAVNTFTLITVNLPVNRALTDVKNIGSGSGFNTFGEYWVAIAQTGTNNNTVSVSFRAPSTSTGNITLFVQYDITQ